MTGRTKRMLKAEAPYWVIGFAALTIWTFVVAKVTAGIVEPVATMVAVNSGISK